MFRSFFPEPRLFFASALVWTAVTMLAWFTVGDAIRSVISVDRFTSPAICSTEQAAQIEAAQAANLPEDENQAADGLAAPSTPDAPTSDAPSTSTATTATTGPDSVALPDCVIEDANFLSGAKIWQYQYIVLAAILFCVFWYFYKRNEWYWWSVVGSTAILLAVYFNVQIDAWLNDWYGNFYNMVQTAMTTPGSVELSDYYGEIVTVAFILVPNILALVVVAFFTSHYVFRWRKAMNHYYMSYWRSIKGYEGAAQRVQEDTMRFASIVEGLADSFVGSFMTLIVFLPLLWELSSNITELPLIGPVDGSMVWVALISASLGTVLLAAVGFKLPGLNFENQKVEAAYRKELVYGEDDATRADPPTVSMLFSHVQRNYFRLYMHYLYFNIARYAYLQGAVFIPYLALGPSIIGGAITLGLFQQIFQAFGQVSSSFRFLVSSWTTIIELLSVHKRLLHFERAIPADAEAAPINLTPSGA